MVVTLSLSVNWKVKLSTGVIEATSFRVMFALLTLLLAECVYDYRGREEGGPSLLSSSRNSMVKFD